jgi:hypothetical protein
MHITGYAGAPQGIHLLHEYETYITPENRIIFNKQS